MSQITTLNAKAHGRQERLDTALRWASYKGEIGAATRLLSLGANPDSVDPEHGWGALQRAALCGHLDIALLLLKAGAHVDATDHKGGCALASAIYFGEGYQVSEALLKAGANPLVANDDGDTPLHLACKESLHAEAELLIRYGGWTLTRNREGRTPLDIAIDRSWQPGLVGLLAHQASAQELRDVLDVWVKWAAGALQAGVDQSTPAYPFEDQQASCDPIRQSLSNNVPSKALERVKEAMVILARWEERDELEDVSHQTQAAQRPRL